MVARTALEAAKNLLTKPKKNTGRIPNEPGFRPKAPGSNVQEFEILEAGQSPSTGETFGLADSIAATVDRGGLKIGTKTIEEWADDFWKENKRKPKFLPWPWPDGDPDQGPKRPAGRVERTSEKERGLEGLHVMDIVSAEVERAEPPTDIIIEDDPPDDKKCEEIEEALRVVWPNLPPLCSRGELQEHRLVSERSKGSRAKTKRGE